MNKLSSLRNKFSTKSLTIHQKCVLTGSELLLERAWTKAKIENARAINTFVSVDRRSYLENFEDQPKLIWTDNGFHWRHCDNSAA